MKKGFWILATSIIFCGSRLVYSETPQVGQECKTIRYSNGAPASYRGIIDETQTCQPQATINVKIAQQNYIFMDKACNPFNSPSSKSSGALAISLLKKSISKVMCATFTSSVAAKKPKSFIVKAKRRCIAGKVPNSSSLPLQYFIGTIKSSSYGFPQCVASRQRIAVSNGDFFPECSDKTKILTMQKGKFICESVLDPATPSPTPTSTTSNPNVPYIVTYTTTPTTTPTSIGTSTPQAPTLPTFTSTPTPTLTPTATPTTDPNAVLTLSTSPANTMLIEKGSKATFFITANGAIITVKSKVTGGAMGSTINLNGTTSYTTAVLNSNLSLTIVATRAATSTKPSQTASVDLMINVVDTDVSSQLLPLLPPDQVLAINFKDFSPKDPSGNRQGFSKVTTVKELGTDEKKNFFKYFTIGMTGSEVNSFPSTSVCSEDNPALPSGSYAMRLPHNHDTGKGFDINNPSIENTHLTCGSADTFFFAGAGDNAHFMTAAAVSEQVRRGYFADHLAANTFLNPVLKVSDDPIHPTSFKLDTTLSVSPESGISGRQVWEILFLPVEEKNSTSLGGTRFVPAFLTQMDPNFNVPFTPGAIRFKIYLSTLYYNGSTIFSTPDAYGMCIDRTDPLTGISYTSCPCGPNQCDANIALKKYLTAADFGQLKRLPLQLDVWSTGARVRVIDGRVDENGKPPTLASVDFPYTGISKGSFVMQNASYNAFKACGDNNNIGCFFDPKLTVKKNSLGQDQYHPFILMPHTGGYMLRNSDIVGNLNIHQDPDHFGDGTSISDQGSLYLFPQGKVTNTSTIFGFEHNSGDLTIAPLLQYVDNNLSPIGSYHVPLTTIQHAEIIDPVPLNAVGVMLKTPPTGLGVDYDRYYVFAVRTFEIPSGHTINELIVPNHSLYASGGNPAIPAQGSWLDQNGDMHIDCRTQTTSNVILDIHTYGGTGKLPGAKSPEMLEFLQVTGYNADLKVNAATKVYYRQDLQELSDGTLRMQFPLTTANINSIFGATAPGSHAQVWFALGDKWGHTEVSHFNLYYTCENRP